MVAALKREARGPGGRRMGQESLETEARQRLSRIAGVSLLLLSAAGCSPTASPPADEPPASETWTTMYTFAAVSVPARERERLAQYVDAARATFDDLEKKLNFYDPASELSQLNEAAGTNRLTVSAETADILRHVLRYGEISRGTFDPTVGPLMRLWGFGQEKSLEKPPDAATLQATLKAVGYRHIVLSNDTAYLDAPGVRVDLGGIVKGYAVDLVYEKLVRLGATNVMVNLGGNIRCTGLARPGKVWTVGVRNPFDREQVLGSVRLSGGMAVGTSGNYERFVTIGGKRYAHIMDPRTGYPVEGVAGVTVICKTGVDTEGMSKTFFVLGLREAGDILARVPDCHVLLIPDEQPIRILVSPGFAACFTPDPAFADRVSLIGN